VSSLSAIRDLVEPALASSGLELWDVEVSRDTVRVLVDKPGGIDLDSLAAVAGRVVSPLLDEHPELTPPGQFNLEVSSPGVERTLRSVDQFRRYLGSAVTVKTAEPVVGSRRHRGRLLHVDETCVRITPDEGPAGAVVELRYEQIQRARTVLEWSPGGGRAPARRGAGRQAAGAPRVAAGSPRQSRASRRPSPPTDPKDSRA
jgi:ribosome maturation factor RimP